MILQKVKNTVNRALEWTLIVLMAGNVLNVLWQVFTRFVLKNPSSFTEELARYLLIWVGLMGASYAAGKKKHLSIDVVVNRLQIRTRRVVEYLIQTFIFLFALLVLVFGGIRLVAITLTLNQISAALRIKLGYVYLVLPLSGLLLMFYAVCFIFETHRKQKGNSNKAQIGLVEGM
ncbi:MAG: TRAP transporter small permease [Candidatus Aminicenantes bacterium]|jgi:TRAP-type C4-dicarboxylate transport system permease small subunit